MPRRIICSLIPTKTVLGIEESGTHDELLAKKGVYYRLWTQLPGEDTL